MGRYWARKGLRPIEQVEPKYQNFYIYSSVSPHTGESFILFLPWVNTEVMNLYLEHLSATYRDYQILLIWDQAGWHGSKDLQVPDNIQIEPLPPYSPELNPVERLWRSLRRHVCRNQLFESEETLMDALAIAVRDFSPSKLATLCHCSYL